MERERKKEREGALDVGCAAFFKLIYEQEDDSPKMDASQKSREPGRWKLMRYYDPLVSFSRSFLRTQWLCSHACGFLRNPQRLNIPMELFKLDGLL